MRKLIRPGKCKVEGCQSMKQWGSRAEGCCGKHAPEAFREYQRVWRKTRSA